MTPRRADIENEYRKNPNLKKSDVETLIKWSEDDSSMPKLDELQAILFLHSCRFELGDAKKTATKFYEIKRSNLALFSNRDPNSDAIKAISDVCLMTTLPNAPNRNDLIFFFKFMDCDPSKFDYGAYSKFFDMVLMAALYQTGTTDGLVLVADQTGVTFRHILKMNLWITKVFMLYAQEALPIPVKGMHYINAVPFIDKLLAITRPFMKKELMNMIHVHSNVEKLYEHVPQECLPEEYGGGAASLKNLHEKQKKFLVECAEFFQNEDRQLNVVDENTPNNVEQDENSPKNRQGFFRKSMRFISFR